MSKRKTGIDYRKDYQDLQDSERSLKVNVSKRLFELSTQYPNVQLPDSTLKLMSGELCKLYIDNLKIEYQIRYIEAIEKWVADQHPHKQKEISFPEINVIPAGPVGERVIFRNGKAYSRKKI